MTDYIVTTKTCRTCGTKYEYGKTWRNNSLCVGCARAKGEQTSRDTAHPEIMQRQFKSQ